MNAKIKKNNDIMENEKNVIMKNECNNDTVGALLVSPLVVSFCTFSDAIFQSGQTTLRAHLLYIF